MVKKLIKELVDGDKVYVVNKDPDTIMECEIKIKIGERWLSPEGYFTETFRGVLSSGDKKMSSNHFGSTQVFHIGTAGIWNEECTIKEKDLWKYWPCSPGGVVLEKYNEMLNSTWFEVYNGFAVFTDLEDAKEYIVEKKLKNIKEDLKKLVKVKKFKKEENND